MARNTMAIHGAEKGNKDTETQSKQTEGQIMSPELLTFRIKIKIGCMTCLEGLQGKI